MLTFSSVLQDISKNLRKSSISISMAAVLIMTGNSSTVAFPRLAPQGKIYVLLIAIQDYKKLQRVPYAANDIKSVQHKFEEKLKFYTTQKFDVNGKSGQMLVLSTENKDEQQTPTCINILETFNQLNFILQPQDTLIVYWTGHGQEYDNKHFLLTSDTNLASGPLRDRTTVTIDALKNSLYKVIVHRFIFFIDTCRTDPNIKSGDTPNPLNDDFTRGAGTLAKEIAQNGEYAILWACRSKQAAYPYSDANNGAFTYFVLQAIDQVKPLTMQNIARYVESHVKDWSIKRASAINHATKFEDLQEPWLDVGSGSGTIPLGDDSDLRLSLTVKTNVPATITIDNHEVKDGVYSAYGEKKRVKVVTGAPGYATETQFVTLEAGEPQELQVNLEPTRPAAGSAPTHLSSKK